MSSSSYSSTEEHPVIKSGTLIGEFEVFRIIGEGGYGQIYEVIQQRTNVHYGMKVEYLSSHNKGLRKEIEIMRDVQISCEFPEFITSGHTKTFRYLIMELLGPSLSQLCKILPTRTLSRYTLLHLGIHMIHCIQALHEMGYIHRDVKPGNFLIRPMRVHPICFIDFGLARKYVTDTGAHKPPRKHPGYTGTYRFASLNAHEETELSRRDDLFSWFYSMVELADGRLPWPPSDGKKITIQIKKEIAPEELSRMLTPEFVEIYKMINSLKYEDEPDYNGIVKLLQTAIKNQNFTQHKYDWELFNGSQLASITAIPLRMDEPAFSDDEARGKKATAVEGKAKKGKNGEENGGCCTTF
ncbi:CK1 family protein kinase [Tritrichomonas foetus]|uniref:non-specific serine/threonine protein kinase n=1 Tax=Tritrichomonas foetus TaxID=1144522 RepID=A0A1J4JZ14_9EUKA|nr:CK1 family protein kinase [Tritrichomonas foetus]|eukprot:OHT04415.1 CK1 family protein kinase [Tritrichomonas foetus]